MSRILKALLKTILCIAIMALIGIIVYLFPYIALCIVLAMAVLALFISFYDKED